MIVSNGDAKALVYYVTDYVTKSSLTTYNYYSILKGAVEELEVGRSESSKNYAATEDALDRSRRLLIRCYNQLQSQQERLVLDARRYCDDWFVQRLKGPEADN